MKKRKFGAIFMVFVFLLALAGCNTVPKSSPIEKITGRIEARTVNDTNIFVFIPDKWSGNLGPDPDRWSAPIVLVYGDRPWTRVTALQTAYDSGLAAIAAKAHACISFVNPKGADWDSVDDRKTYLDLNRELYVERPGNTYANGKESNSNKYAGFYARVVVIGEGTGADFVSGTLVDDELVFVATNSYSYQILDPNSKDDEPVFVTTAYSQVRYYNSLPSAVMLFNVKTTPTDAGNRYFEYPAVVVNGTSAVEIAYKALNKNPAHILTYNGITNGIDPNRLKSGWDNLAGYIFRYQLEYANEDIKKNSVRLWDIGNYEALNMTAEYKNRILSNGYTGGAGPWAPPDPDAVPAYGISYIEYTPARVASSPAGTVPLVVGFHGDGERGEYFGIMTGWPELAAKEGFFFVAVNHQNNGIEQKAELIDLLMAEHSFIDPSRVYVTGFSMGSMTTAQLGLRWPRKFAAVAPMDGLPFEPEDTVNTTHKLGWFYITGEHDIVGMAENSPQIQTGLGQIFETWGLPYSYESPRFFWGIDFPAANVEKINFEGDIFTINSVKNTKGETVVKLGSVSNMRHTLNRDLTSYVWDFFKKFSRMADGTLAITQ
jgi:pimeloyl-ACP methyl ester carboxylesterase